MNNSNSAEGKILSAYTLQDLLESYAISCADPDNFFDGLGGDRTARKHVSALQDLADNGVVGPTGKVNFAAIELVKKGVAQALEWYFDEARIQALNAGVR
jgi:hypothetical protein